MAWLVRVRRTRPGSEGGSTLLELMVALAVLSILLTALLLVWGRGLAAYMQGSETADLQQEARIAHERMTEELRLAGMRPCLAGTLDGAVTAGAADSVTVQYFPFTAAFVDDCSTGGWPRRTTTYRYDAGTRTLQRAVNGGAFQALTGGTVETLTFQYFNCAGTELLPPGDLDTQPKRDGIARIAVTVAAQETFSGAPLTRALVSSVRLRNTPCTGGI